MKIDKNKVIFLLGGHDLEMITIRDLLDENNISYFDESQKWGAKLSDYIKRLEENPDKVFYVVELEIDKALDKKYKIEIIDHHNELSDRKASVLQVLELLNKKSTRMQSLIAVNDARYIEGMKSLGATDSEILEIRQKDKEAQGVTWSDILAGKNDAKSKKVENNTAIICATTSYFSTITDSLYLDFPSEDRQNRTIIHNDSEIVFYGFSIDGLKGVCNKLCIDRNVYYYGGGNQGFFGIKKNVLTTDTMKKLQEKVLKTKELYSTHIFMFPFIFEKEVKDVNKVLTDNIKWNKRVFDLGADHRNYNEYTYFYTYARKALYNLEDNETETTSTYFEYKEKEGKFILNAKEKIFTLDLDGIAIRTFDTGIGILSIEVINRCYPDAKDILQINDFGRRLYPQFVSEDACDGKAYSLEHVKNALHPCSVAIHLNNEEKVEETFDYYTKRSNLQEDATQMPKYIHHLLGQEFSSNKKNDKLIHIEPIIDDRMFVISMYMKDNLANNMKIYNYVDNRYAYEDNDFWYEYVFVDGNGITCKSKHMKCELIKEATYDRWIEEGTLFGISRYSFAVLSKNDWFANNVLKVHMFTMYFQIFTLLLAYRASILKFSHRVAVIDVTNYEDSRFDELQKDVSSVYADYINFQNKLFFREVTAQDQGIELYNKALGIMQIKEQIADLDKEIEELHTYVSMKAEKSRNDRLENISKLGAVFLPPSLLAGIYGMNVFNFNKTEDTLIITLLAMLLSAIIGYLLISKSTKWKLKSIRKFAWKSILITVMFVVIFGSLMWMGEDKNTPSIRITQDLKNDTTEGSIFIRKVKMYMQEICSISEEKVGKMKTNKGEK